MEASDSTDDVLELVDILASDFIARYRHGDRPTVEEYARRHPGLSEMIRRMFPLAASIERIKISEQISDDGSASLAGRVLLQLGDFRIIREIGRGGMGIVFEAYQESLDRTVAIKVLPQQCLLDDEALQRFRTEATTAAAMHHANIVPIYGTGESDGSHYLVMQLVKGQSLDRLLASSNLSSYLEAARICEQVADAVAYSHANGVLHRDIKPANILIEEDGTAQVTDFGLAKMIGTEQTNTRSVSGSLRYMAPERFSGISDQRSDIYGIGLTLYELLAGRPAFEEQDAEHLIGSITNSQLLSIKTIRPDVPTDLAVIVSKAIHLDPDLRFQSAAELRDDLRRFLADEPIHARRISSWGRLTRWTRRNPKQATTISIAAFSLLAATVVSTVAYALTSAANRRSTMALHSSEQTVDLALQSLDGVVGVVSGMPVSTSLEISDSFDDESLPNIEIEPSPHSARILEQLQPVYERLSRQSPNRPDIILQMVDASIQLARIQHSLGRTMDSLTTLNASISILEQRKQSASIPSDELHLRLARLYNELGGMHAAAFQSEQAQRCYKSSIQAATKLDPSHVAGQIELARAHLGCGYRPPNLRRDNVPTAEQRDASLTHVNEALEVLQSLKDAQQQTTSVDILYARSLLARSRLASNPRDRHDDLRRAVSLLRDQVDESTDNINVRFELVETLADVNIRGLRSQGRLRDAHERLSEALDEISKLRSSYPDNQLFLASEVHLRHKLSAVAKSQFRFDRAEAMLGEAIRLQTMLMQKSPDSVRHRCWRAMLYRSQAAMYRDWGSTDKAKDAIVKGKSDIDAIDIEFSDHPLVIRTREAVNELLSEL